MNITEEFMSKKIIWHYRHNDVSEDTKFPIGIWLNSFFRLNNYYTETPQGNIHIAVFYNNFWLEKGNGYLIDTHFINLVRKCKIFIIKKRIKKINLLLSRFLPTDCISYITDNFIG